MAEKKTTERKGTYEESMAQLERILAQLEDGKTGIDEGIALYEQGIEIARVCLERLNESKGRVTVLQQRLDKLVETEFRTDDGDL